MPKKNRKIKVSKLINIEIPVNGSECNCRKNDCESCQVVSFDSYDITIKQGKHLAEQLMKTLYDE